MSEVTRQQLEGYINDLFAPEDETLLWIQKEAEANGLPRISIQPFEGRLLQFLMRTIAAKKVVEIGTLAGYSGTWIARALPAGGMLYTLEKSGTHAKIARAAFERGGIISKITLLEGEAMQSLRRIQDRAPFDFVFIDADKASYAEYFEWAVEHLRPGGMLAAHNAFRNGGVILPSNTDDHAMDRFNKTVARHPRLESFIIGMGDGMTVAVKRGD